MDQNIVVAKKDKERAMILLKAKANTGTDTHIHAYIDIDTHGSPPLIPDHSNNFIFHFLCKDDELETFKNQSKENGHCCLSLCPSPVSRLMLHSLLFLSVKLLFSIFLFLFIDLLLKPTTDYTISGV